MTSRTLLVLSASVGSGHTSAATNLESQLRKEQSGWNIVHVNICDFAPKWQRFLLEDIWLAFSTWPLLRKFYGLIHRKVVCSDRLALHLCRFFSIITANLMRHFGGQRVVALIALHPGAACVARIWRLQADIYTCAVATDMVVHSFHAMPGIDRVFGDKRGAFTSYHARILKNSDQFVNSGLPVGGESVGNKLIWVEGLKREFSVLVTFGSSGARLVRHIFRILRLAHALPDIHLTIVCGRNKLAETLYSSFVASLGLRNQISVLGFVKDMRSLVRGSDIVVGKAGGITIAESLAESKSFVAIDFLPGQEEYNVNFLVNECYGYAAFNLRALLQAINYERKIGYKRAPLHIITSGVACISETTGADLAKRISWTKRIKKTEQAPEASELIPHRQLHHAVGHDLFGVCRRPFRTR